MCGGGGVEAPDPVAQAKAEIMRLQEQYRLDQQRADQEYARQKEQEAADRAQWETDLGNARTTTRGLIDQQFTDAGLDVADYDSRIRSALDLAQSGIAYGSSPTFSTELGSEILGDVRDAQIKDYNRGLDAFAGQGFADEAFGSTADDAILEAILGEQFGEASDSILRARDRGTLNDAGFQYAMDNLNTQKTAARSRLEDIGGGILGGYRDELNTIGSNARNAANNWDFGDTFDLQGYQDSLTNKQNDFSGRLEGDIRNAIGGEQFFNTNDLIQKGGVGQGAQNTGLGAQSGSLLGAITDKKKEEEQERGLGTTGSF